MAIRICYKPENPDCNGGYMDTRAIAARILDLVLQEEKHLDLAFSELIPTAIEAREQAFIKELCYGVMRWYYRLEFFLDRLLNNI